MKKYIYFDLFHLSLVLSLLRLYPNLYRGTSTWETEPYGHEVYLGDSSAYTQTRFHNLNNQLNGFVHPKNVDDALERSLFIHDVNSLYRSPSWNSNSPRRGTNVFAYIVNELQPNSLASTAQEDQESQSSESQSEATATDLTQADMNLIEILWKQDIDLGLSREVFDGSWKSKNEQSLKQDEKSSNLSTSSTSFDNPWQGLNYSVDSETGEHIALPSNGTGTTNNAAALVPNSYVDISLEEALSLFENENLNDEVKPTDLLTVEDLFLSPEDPYQTTTEDRSLLDQLQDLQDLVSESQSEPFFEQYGVMNQTFLELPTTYNETDNSNAILDALLQNTSLALPMDDSLLNVSFNSGEEFDTVHSSNINTLLSFLSNDSDPHPIGAVGGQDQNELCPSLPIANLTVDTNFLSELINEDNVDYSNFADPPDHLTIHGNWHTSASTSSDSAVSSMGSDWSDSNSVGSSNGNSNVQSYSTSFGFGIPPHSLSNAERNVKPALASPKKYQLFGKKQLMESNENEELPQSPGKGKFVPSCSSPDEEYRGHSSSESSSPTPKLSIMHNHTYHCNGDAVADKNGPQIPLERDKPETHSESSLRASRDEKRLRNYQLPLTLKEIIELPIEQFNERLSQITLNEEQLSLIRDIRRRGKNKLAARTCRKRKIDQISDLQDVLDTLQEKRNMARLDLEKAVMRRDLLKQKYERLYRFIFPDVDPPEPVPSSFYLPGRSLVPQPQFPVCSNGTSSNETDNKKRGKHKGSNNK